MAEAHSMHNDKESPFTLTLVEDDLSWQVLQFSGHEALNQPYRFDIEVIGLAPAMNLDRVLQQPAYLSLGDGQGFHGVVHSASREQRDAQRIGYRLVLVPHLQRLEQALKRRVFQQLDVPAIVRQLLSEHALPEDSYRLELNTGHYPVRPFCIQYEESDLALMQRLCEEEGIHYHFEHSIAGHVVVFADDSSSFPQAPVITPFHGDAFDEPSFVAISEMFQRLDSPPIPPLSGANDRGMQVLGADAANHPPSDMPRLIGHPGAGQMHSEQRSRRTLQQLRCQHRQMHGKSDQTALLSGRVVQVEQHPLASFNDQWLLTEVRHQGRQSSILARDSASRPAGYCNEFSAIVWSSVFRPALKQPRPIIPGYQPGRVMGVPGQAPTLDELGRIEVSLWPDSNTQVSQGIWLPVALGAAGMPLAGSEVYVSFLDSDPDRPIVCAEVNPQKRRKPPAATPRGDTRLLLDWLVNCPNNP